MGFGAGVRVRGEAARPLNPEFTFSKDFTLKLFDISKIIICTQSQGYIDRIQRTCISLDKVSLR